MAFQSVKYDLKSLHSIVHAWKPLVKNNAFANQPFVPVKKQRKNKKKQLLDFAEMIV